MSSHLPVVHLRHASGSGGGPEKTLLKSGQLIDRDRFSYRVMYLTNEGGVGASTVTEKARSLGLDYREFASPRFISRPSLAALADAIGYGPVIVHTHDPKTNVWGWFLKRRLPRAWFVSTVHGWIVRSWKSRFYHFLEGIALRRFDAVVAVSQATQEHARRRGIANTELIYNAIDLDEWQPAADAPPGDPLVGYVGRISREKGPLDFVKVAARVASRKRRVGFLVAGDGPLAGEMRALAEELGIGGRIRFLGQVPGADIGKLYRSLCLLLSPSRTEGLPNNLLEAGATGVPVVATAVGGVGEVIRHGRNGLLAPAGNISLLTSHVLELLDDREAAGRMRVEARRLIEEKFSFRRRMRAMEDLYLRVAGTGRAG